jgi:(R,R)-butanediol dehydrogenase/meso-butanediol dehydrogenase/diacetyl reductase
MIAAGDFPVEKVVTARIDAEDVIAKGFEALLEPAGNHLKIVVRTWRPRRTSPFRRFDDSVSR